MDENSPIEINRRDALKGTAAVMFAHAANTLSAQTSTAADEDAGLELPTTQARRDPGLIRRENAKPGAQDWQLTRVRLDKSGGLRCPPIEGYCSRQSVAAGESFDIMVSTDPPHGVHH